MHGQGRRGLVYLSSGTAMQFIRATAFVIPVAAWCEDGIDPAQRTAPLHIAEPAARSSSAISLSEHISVHA